MPQPARILLVHVAVAALFVAGAVPAASAVPEPVPKAAPTGFTPSSTSWPSAARGWVLGFAPCRSGSCPVLLRTNDGGDSWARRPAPPVEAAPTQERVRVSFANGEDGLVTNGHQLFATHDAAETWQPVRLPDATQPVSIRTLETSSRYAYAVVAAGTGATARTRLYSSPLRRTRWHPVSGVAIDGRGGWDVAARDSGGEVALGEIFASSRYWTTRDGRTWHERQAPCPATAKTGLDDTSSLPLVFALCSSDPRRGHMRKELKISVRGLPFVSLGPAPYPGITTDFAVASPTTAAVAAVAGGQSFLYVTFDGGRTWNESLVRPGGGFRDLDFQDARHGVAVLHNPASAAAVYRTEDGGHSWSRLSLATQEQ